MQNKDWNDITLDQYYKMTTILERQDDYATLDLLDLIYGIDSSNSTLAELGQYKDALNFISTNIPEAKLKETYELNGTVYRSNFDLTVVTAAQFIDYQNYANNKTEKWEDYLSIFFIPEGHKYNDGYNMKTVKKDMMSLPITVVRSITFFFTRQFETFMHLFLSSLKKSLKKMNLTKEQEKELMEKIDQADLISLESYLH